MEKKHFVGNIICVLLTVTGIVDAVIHMIGRVYEGSLLWYCAQLAFFALILFYAFAGYKNPHGNLLKYLMLLYAVSGLASIPAYNLIGENTGVTLTAIEIGLRCYIAGRLDKVRENMILMVIVTICLVAEYIMTITKGYYTIAECGLALVPWLDICVAYFLRYKEHKEAGLIDAPKAK